MNWNKVEDALEQAAHPYTAGGQYAPDKQEIVFPGAVLLVGCGGEVLFEKAVGCRSLLPELTPMETGLVFDVASLTKALVTTTLLMKLVEQSVVDIDRPLSRVLQTFGSLGKEQMTIRHLLAHCSGYPALIPFYKRVEEANRGERAGIMGTRAAAEMIFYEIFRARLDNMPGRVTAYSDVGFILLGHLIEVALGGTQLDVVATKEIVRPLQLQDTGFIDYAKLKSQGLSPVSEMIVPTADCPWRKKLLCGEVYDDNAWAMGGVAGHAGLFSTARDVHAIASELLACWQGSGSLLPKEIVRKFWTRDETVAGSSWALGWDTPSAGASTSGQFFSPQSVGHLGFTGCSLWIDPEREIDVVLLSNRIHPSIQNTRIKAFRPQIHDLVMEVLGFGE